MDVAKRQQAESRRTGEQLSRMLFDYVGRYVYFPLKWGGASADHTWPNMWFERRTWPNGILVSDSSSIASGAEVIGERSLVGRPLFADARNGWMW